MANKWFRHGVLLALVVILADQISKWWIVEKIMRPEGVVGTPFFTPERIEILPVFNLVMAWNRGVSFGMFNNDGQWNALILSVLSVAVSVGLLIWLRKAENRLVALSIGSIIGGALGNVVDRVRWGAVADFVDLHVLGYHWPAFNVADSAICVGATLMVLESLFNRSEESQKQGHDQ
jgi:signal peptidase II